jgi:peroxiredoxin
MINHITLLLFVLLSVRGVFAGFPDTIKDIDGVVLDLKQLTSQKRLAVITLKTAECPVCQKQLIRIKEKLSELIVCNITFIVLSPGSIDKIQKAKSKTQFPYPFIDDEDLASKIPHKIAAALPVCGVADLKTIHKMKDIPTWIFHGDQDQVILVKNSLDAFGILDQINPNVHLTIYEGIGHDSWTETYQNPDVLDWMLSQQNHR